MRVHVLFQIEAVSSLVIAQLAFVRLHFAMHHLDVLHQAVFVLEFFVTGLAFVLVVHLPMHVVCRQQVELHMANFTRVDFANFVQFHMFFVRLPFMRLVCTCCALI